jgi:O-antigen biosynthesis protein
MMTPLKADAAQYLGATLVRRVTWMRALVRLLISDKKLKRRTLRIISDYRVIERSNCFDRSFYLACNPDVAQSGMDPLLHYLLHGEREGRRPSAVISAKRLDGLMRGRPKSSHSALALLLRGEGERPTIDPILERRALALPRIVRPHGPASHKKLVVYTAVFDQYDLLPTPSVASELVDYVCFSEREISNPGVWRVRSIDYFHHVPRRMARYAKLHPHRYFPNYEWSLWVDGRIALRIDPIDLLRQCDGEGDFFAFYHPMRSTPFEEGSEVIRLDLDDHATVANQMERYRSLGLPEETTLHETGVLLRRHGSDAVVNHSRTWWSEIAGGSLRDQLSFDFAAWRARVPILPLAEHGTSVRNDSRFLFSTHRTPERSARAWLLDMGLTNPPAFVTEPRAIRRDEADEADIVVCIHNALEDVVRCLNSVDRARIGRERLILVDDGSDSETRDWLRSYALANADRTALLRRGSAGGYTIAANVGLRESNAPNVVMLNSDVIVPRGWLKKLHDGAHAGLEIGLVGPLSNAASYQSVPQLTAPDGGFLVNILPPKMSVDQMDALCGQIGDGLYARVPALNGFCMLIRRAVIDRIGLFDEATFPEGYGEENDYCLRAADAGFSAAIACNSYVYHAKSRSYTSARRNQLAAKATAAIKAKWSESRLSDCSRTMEDHPWLAIIRSRVANELRRSLS